MDIEPYSCRHQYPNQRCGNRPVWTRGQCNGLVRLDMRGHAAATADRHIVALMQCWTLYR